MAAHLAECEEQVVPAGRRRSRCRRRWRRTGERRQLRLDVGEDHSLRAFAILVGEAAALVGAEARVAGHALERLVGEVPGSAREKRRQTPAKDTRVAEGVAGGLGYDPRVAGWHAYLDPREALGRLRRARADLYATRVKVDRLAETASELSAAIAACQDVNSRADERHRALLDALRVVRDDDASARATLWTLRQSDEYEKAFEEEEPLVTVLLTTYDNWPLLGERSLPAVLAQTYEHWGGDRRRRRRTRRRALPSGVFR